MMRTRLEMWDIRKNLGGEMRTCKECYKEEEKTEHILEYLEARRRNGLKRDVEWLNGDERQQEQVTRYMERYVGLERLGKTLVEKWTNKAGRAGDYRSQGPADLVQ